MQNGRTAPHAPCLGWHVTIFSGVYTSSIQLNIRWLASSSTLRFRPNCKTNQIQITYRQILSSTVMTSRRWYTIYIPHTPQKVSFFLLFKTVCPTFAYITYTISLFPSRGSVVYTPPFVLVIGSSVRTPSPSPTLITTFIHLQYLTNSCESQFSLSSIEIPTTQWYNTLAPPNTLNECVCAYCFTKSFTTW